MQIHMFSEYAPRALLSESDSSTVIRAARKTDNQLVILKTLPTDKPTPAAINRIKREYGIIAYLNRNNVTGVANAHKLHKIGNLWLIEMEDIQGQSLNILMDAKPFAIQKFLQIAIKTTSIVDKIHAHGIIHKDINPSNIVLNVDTCELTLIDFGCAREINQETLPQDQANAVEGTLAYISPEQTGRTNTLADQRSDLYSLGVTFYQLVTGRLPFETENPLDYLHFHIARQAIPAHKVYIGIPKSISDIISKLLCKNPADRYQSATGLKADLQRCLGALQLIGRIKPFPLGAEETENRLQLPKKLYGREKPLNLLIKAYKQNFSGVSSFVVISGPSGIGIKSLVNEIHKTITKYHSYFISGKFDHTSQDTPFSGIIEAFRSLIRQFLTEPAEKLAKIKTKLISVMGPYRSFFVSFIPELELLIEPKFKKSNSIPLKGDPYIQNQILKIVKTCINLMSSDKRPVVLFLIDMQWADADSYRFLQGLLVSKKPSNIFVIAAYRQTKRQKHPLLSQMLSRLKQHQLNIRHIRLNPLGIQDIHSLICDTLTCGNAKGHELAKLIHDKTFGIPFYVDELLKSFYERKLIYYDSIGKKWRWAIDQIRASALPDNMGALVAERIIGLEPDLQKLLTTAAFLGDSFDKHILDIASADTIKSMDLLLDKAVSAGLIIPISNSGPVGYLNPTGAKTIDCYRFAHDKIRKAAYKIVPEGERKLKHWHIGSLILKHTRNDLLDNYLFIIVNQLNIGFSWFKSKNETHKLAHLNLMAAKRANLKAAYASAMSFFNKAIELLGPDHWAFDYQLSLELYNEAAVSALTEHDFDTLERKLIPAILKNAKSVLDRVTVNQITIQFLNTQEKFAEALKTGLSFLRNFNICFPESPRKHHILKETAVLKWRLSRMSSSQILNLPIMTSRFHIATMRILVEISVAALFLGHNVLILAVSKMIKLTLKHGLCSLSAYSFGFLGHAFCTTANGLALGQRLGQVALDLANQFSNKKIINCVRLGVNSHIFIWKKKPQKLTKIILQTCRNSIEEGDTMSARCTGVNYSCFAFFFGTELSTVNQQLSELKNAIACINSEKVPSTMNIIHQTVTSFQKKPKRAQLVEFEPFDQRQNSALPSTETDKQSYFYYSFLKAILCYHFGEIKLAAKFSALALQHIKRVAGTVFEIQFCFYDALVQVALIDRGLGSKQRRKAFRTITKYSTTLSRYAEQTPMIFLNKYYLVEAEKNRINAKPMHKILSAYKKAIYYASQHELKHEEALAKELAGRYFEKMGDNISATGYYREAQYCYELWGASAKNRWIEQKIISLGLTNKKFKSTIAQTKTGTSRYNEFSSTTAQLDVSSVMKSIHTFAKENDHQKLSTALLKSLLQSAGGERGAVFVMEADNYRLEASVGFPSISATQRNASRPSDRLTKPLNVLNYVTRTKQPLILHNAFQDRHFSNDPYIATNKIRSILCIPFQQTHEPLGIVYLENNLLKGVFAEERLPFLSLLTSMSGPYLEILSLRNMNEAQARSVEQQVATQTHQLTRANRELKMLLDQRAQDMMTLLKNSPNATYIKDEKARFLWTNDRFKVLYNVSESDIRGKTSHEVFGDVTAARCELFDIQVLTDRLPFQYQEIIRHKGEERIYLSLKFPIFNDQSESLRIGGILVDITNEKRAQQQIRQLSVNLIENQEKERAAIARELHDELGQVLTILSMDADWITRKLEANQPKEAQRARKMTDLIAHTQDNVRDLAIRLRPRILDDLGVVKALEWYSDEFHQRSGIVCNFQSDITAPPNGTVATTIYRITQEALTNIARHSGATRAEVILFSENYNLTLTIKDNGKGFYIQSSTNGQPKAGLGLDGMRERAELAGGYFKVDSKPGHGTTISLELPFQEKESENLEAI